MNRVLRYAFAIIITGLVTARFAPLKALDQNPAGFYLVAVDDCGNPAHEAHLMQGRDAEIPASLAPMASPEERTTSGGEEVVYRYSGLPPAERYKLRVVYLSDHAGQAVKLSAGSVELQPRFDEPDHKAAKREIDVPSSAIQNGVLELKFESGRQGEASVSLIELWCTSSALANNLHLQVGGDSRGGVTGAVTDWLNRPSPRTSIRVHYPNAVAEIGAMADAAGRFSIRAPVALHSLAPELVSVQASRGEFSTSSTIHSLEIFPPDIRLTPRPSIVSGLDTLKQDLGGTWNFVVQPPPRFWEQGAVPLGQINSIQVPGEWSMQGYSVPKGGAAGYWRTAEIPPAWAGKRIKLKCDAVFSLAQVWVNGKKVGQYEGGFTPFEFDITGDIEAGKPTTIALRVEQDTMAADLSAMIDYAQHDLGGITRKIYLFAVPEVNLYRFHAETRFDRQFQDATLHLTLGVANQGKSTVEGVELKLRLSDPEGQTATLAPASVRLLAMRPNEDKAQAVDLTVTKPRHWENEHPRLYNLTGELVVGGRTLEAVERRIGFRQVEIRGNRLLLNGQAIKLHGVERHETNPALGRSLKAGMWSQDAKLLHEANMNYVFTSHYPVPEEFLDACDEVGVLVTEELPSVWVGLGSPGNAPDGSKDPRYYQAMATIAATALEKDRSHTSIVFWQTCDECVWGRNFASLMSLFDVTDPSRPVNFAWEAGTSKFFSQHYPSIDDARKVPGDGAKPTIYDQYTHINNYNRHEHLTDPGLRDYYGKAIAPMWDAMYANLGIAGGAIWEWSDDIFYVPPSGHNRNRFQGNLDPATGRWQVGYGPWGVVDSWLRKKPEFWNVKKAYSPVRIQEHEAIPLDPSGRLHIPVENRYDFTNLNELRIEWSAGPFQGTTTANVSPHSKGFLEVSLPEGASAVQTLRLKFINQGELVDAYDLPVGNGKPAAADEPGTGQTSVPHLEQMEKSLIVRAQDSYWEFDRKSGLLVAGGKSRIPASAVGGPYLAVTPIELDPCCPQIAGPVVPLQPPLMNWAASSVSAQVEDGSVLMRVKGSYPDYEGGYTVHIHGTGGLTLDYRFEYTGAEVLVREIGLLFDIPLNVNTLHWKHQTQWSYYPDGHIGRPEGSAPAFRDASAWPQPIWGHAPPWPWELDSTAGGTNDFRSTKYNIIWASLTNAEGQGVRVQSDGRQSIRAWVDQDRIRLLVTDFSNGGGEPFLRMNHFAHEQRNLRKGNFISGSVRFFLEGESR